MDYIIPTTPLKTIQKSNGMFKRASEIGVDWKNGVYVGDKITDLKAQRRQLK